ncbi:MAG: hypothetical protein E7048_08345 [Lentisphaerae bacterium]|nr:hypothetical protein [Lentisphaerota bacterium]
MQNGHNFSPDPTRPLMMMRLRAGHETPEVWNNLFPQLLENKDCCDEVWFSTGVGFPLLECHREKSRLMGEHAAVLRKAGIIPSLQFQTTIGHSDRIIASAGAEGKTWGSYVGVNGEECLFVNCPRQPGFLEYMGEMSRIYAQWHPGSVWIDDDLRLHNHHPAMEPCGCYCKDCLALFAKEEGKLYTREELVAAYQKDAALFKRWEKFSIESLKQIINIIIENFRKISPETRFGLQHCQNLLRLPVLDALKELSGKRPGSRPGGGAYCDHHPYQMLNKGLLISMQIADQQGYDSLSQIAPEIESCPRTFTCKTSQGHRIESLFYLAMGCDSLSYFIMDPYLETPEWYGRELLKPLAAESACYKEYIRHNAGTLPAGMAVAAKVGAAPNIENTGLPLLGVPLAGCAHNRQGTLLCMEGAELFSEGELEKIFAQGCILGGEAAMALQKRGLNHLLGDIQVTFAEPGSYEYFTDDPLNAALDVRRYSSLSAANYAFECPSSLESRILGVYRNSKGKELKNASLLFTSPAGGRVALFGIAALSPHYISSNRVRQINLAADWVAKEKLPVRSKNPVQLVFVPRVTENGTLRSVTVLNPTIGNQKPFEILLRGVPSNITEAEFLIPSEEPVKVHLHHKEKECSCTLPGLSGWDTGFLKIPAAQ